MSWLKIDHAPDHAGYDVEIDRKLVGRIPWGLTDAVAQSLKDKAAELPEGQVLNLHVTIVERIP